MANEALTPKAPRRMWTGAIVLPLALLGLRCARDPGGAVGETRSTAGMLAEQFAGMVSLEPGYSNFQPHDFDELHAALHKTGFVGDATINQVDAWSRPYVLRPSADQGTGRFYVIVSAGPDGVLGTDDDIAVRTRVPYRPSTSTPSSMPATSRAPQRPS
jgi:hypothetical protein